MAHKSLQQEVIVILIENAELRKKQQVSVKVTIRLCGISSQVPQVQQAQEAHLASNTRSQVSATR